MSMIKFFLLFFIFISSASFGQSRMFWNEIDVSFHKIIITYGAPDGLEYQENGEYWLAYNYGNKNVVYVIDKAIVTSILYLERVENYNDAKISFVELDSLSTSDGFQQLKTEPRFFEKTKYKTQIQVKIVENFDSFIVAIQVKKI